MKKEAVLFTLLITLLTISIVSAIEIQTDKTEFAKGETLFATLTGNILEDVTYEDVGFYRGHVQVPFTYDILKINKTYYIYAITPYVSNDYSLRIKDVYFKENNLVQTKDFEKNFTVTTGLADFNVRPGFIFTQNNFTISAYNNLNSDLEITHTLENSSETTTLPLQETKQIKINIDHLESTLLTFTQIKSENLVYNIPTYIIKEAVEQEPEQPEENQTEEPEEPEIPSEMGKLRFSINEISLNFSKDEIVSYNFKLANLGQSDERDVRIYASDNLKQYVLFSETEIDLIEANQEIELEAVFKFDKTGDFTGMIIAEAETSEDEIILDLFIGEDIEPSSSVSDQSTCDQLGGIKTKECSTGTSIYAADGWCCIQSSTPEPEKRNWTVIIIIIVLLLFVLSILYLKLKKSRPTAKDILEKRKKSFETRGALTRS